MGSIVGMGEGVTGGAMAGTSRGIVGLGVGNRIGVGGGGAILRGLQEEIKKTTERNIDSHNLPDFI